MAHEIQPAQEAPAGGLLLSSEALGAAVDRNKVNGAVDDTDGND
ncbi:hypothetical protein [Saccharothrix algeriensis]|uniref:Uncharacterized protein n=1 Tax=Saccharothrix algeriensis TaxID=173560 RepID=A0ABS2SCK4_9PSEU|nr:hypothetical protein [Saccharothrix algeriensis]MBM7814002.1 hypothetical protein [Saccharothrix algeriensis]